MGQDCNATTGIENAKNMDICTIKIFTAKGKQQENICCLRAYPFTKTILLASKLKYFRPLKTRQSYFLIY